MAIYDLIDILSKIAGLLVATMNVVILAAAVYLLFQIRLGLRIQARRSRMQETQRVVMQNLNTIKDLIEVANLDRQAKKDEDSDDPGDIPQLHAALNYAEAISGGVLAGVYDEELIREMYSSLFLEIYKIAHQTIRRSRYLHNDPTGYLNFERLMEKWDKRSK